MTTPGHTLLHIEDSPPDARLVDHLLGGSSTPWEIERATTLADGLERLSKTSFDAVLLDLFLPDNMGTDTLDQVRAKAPGLPIVVLTSLEDPELSGQALRHGANAVLFKGGVNGEELAATLAQAIRTSNGGAEELVAPTTASETPIRRVLEEGLRAPLEAVLSAWDASALDELHTRGAGTLEDDPCTRIQATGRLLDDVARLLDDVAGLLAAPPVPTEDQASEPGEILDQVLALRTEELVAHDLTVTRGPLPAVSLPADHVEALVDRLLSIALRGDRPGRIHVTGRMADGRTWLTFEDRGGWIGSSRLEAGLAPAQADPPATLETLVDAQILQQLVTSAGGRIQVTAGSNGAGKAVLVALPPAQSPDAYQGAPVGAGVRASSSRDPA